MSHALPCLVAEAGCDQLVIAPHRAIEEYQRSAAETGLEIVRDMGAGSKKIKTFAGCPVADAKSERVACAIAPRAAILAFQLPRARPGTSTGQHVDPRA